MNFMTNVFKAALIFFFLATGGQHNKMWKQSCLQTVAILHIQEIWSNITIHLESCFLPPGECESNILSPFSSDFGLHRHPTPFMS